jgi:hypothetical protein
MYGISGIPKAKQDPAGCESRSSPQCEHPKAGPRADRQAVQISGGLNRESGRHGTDLFQMPMPDRIGHDLGEEWEQVEEPEYDPDRRGGVTYRSGDAEAEQTDEDEVQNGATRRPQRRAISERQQGIAVRDSEALARQDEPPGE